MRLSGGVTVNRTRTIFATTFETYGAMGRLSFVVQETLRCGFGSATLVVPMVVHFHIRGRVQGVGFRWFVHREAAELGLRGWVRNTDSGEVEVVVAGEPAALDELRLELRKGSRGSRVDAVIENELAESEAASLGEFKIEGAW
jgi:acylphosphatase